MLLRKATRIRSAQSLPRVTRNKRFALRDEKDADKGRDSHAKHDRRSHDAPRCGTGTLGKHRRYAPEDESMNPELGGAPDFSSLGS